MSTTLLDKREERIRSMFGAIAPRYDFLNHLLSLNIDRWWRRRAVQLVPPDLNDPAPILDVCTGTGDLALEYHRAAKGQRTILGTDFCLPMLLPAVRKAARVKAQGRISFLEADTQQLPFPDNQFQIVSVAFGLRNVTDMNRGLAEMVRVAKPGGRIAILEFSRPRGFIGFMYTFYFRRILPFVGQTFTRSPDRAYEYLPASVLSFPDGEALAQVMRQHGLDEVRYYPFTFGIATLYVGRKKTPVQL
ncbi:MAG: bifunctional demethylmenaquinone methyltransferase/2-methoxy-6-polyprenyl-1,4-benzoquinol methylase UbiE [Gemmataceae bacterium]